MKCLLHNKKLAFSFIPSYVLCYNVSYYQANEILSFAVMDLAFKIIKQQERNSIVLKKRKPIIYLLNYIDALTLNSNKFDNDFSFKGNCKIKLLHSLDLFPLMYNLYLYRRRLFKDFVYKDNLEVIERENLCTIRFEEDYITRIQPKNINLAAMVIHILEKEKINEINVDGIILYCVFLM
jgi:hypothetical protein